MRALHELCRSPVPAKGCEAVCARYLAACSLRLLELKSTTAVVLANWYLIDLSVGVVCELLMHNIY